MQSQNVSGLELARRFYEEVVGPIVLKRWPDLSYSAALIGPGSEVLGFDDGMSRDHHWGPRLLLFLDPVDRKRMEDPISRHLAASLPFSFLGYPTNFSAPDPEDNGTQLLEEVVQGPVRHRVEITDVAEFLRRYLGIRDWHALGLHDWLTLPEQKLRSLTAGEVFHDGLPARPAAHGGQATQGDAHGGCDGTGGALARLREALAYYPRDVWLFQMAAAWARIGQEEHLMGRAGLVGDEVGSALIAARLIRDIMRLCFLMERTYAPYPKWFGTAFLRLDCGPSLYPALQEALGAGDWKSREASLVRAYETIAAMHNRLRLTDGLPERVKQFFGRPFAVMAIQGFADSLLGQMDPHVLTETMRRSPIGGIDQISDNTDVLEDPALRCILRQLYD